MTLVATGAAAALPATAKLADTTLTSTMTDLGTLGGDWSDSDAVDDGRIVGVAGIARGVSHAFAVDTRTPGNAMVDLGTLGGSSSHAADVSGDVVVGWSEVAAGPDGSEMPDYSSHAFAYDFGAATPTMMDLGTLGGYLSEATAVDGNIVVGEAGTKAGGERAFAYDLSAPTPRMLNLGSLGGLSFATDVSGDLVVGYSYLARRESGADQVIGPHAFVYDLGAENPRMLDLGTFGGDFSRAVAVDGNLVVGVAQTARELWTVRAFVVDMGAATPVMRSLGTLGGRQSEATAVSGTTVVGVSKTATGEQHAFAYDLSAPEPTMRDLGSLGGDSEALAVDGDIVVGESQSVDHHSRAWAYDLASSAPEMADLGPASGGGAATAVEGDLVVGTAGSRAVAWKLTETTAPALEFASLVSEVREDAGQATVTVVRGGQADRAVEVSYTARGGDADGRVGRGQDFVRTSGVLSFGVGETEKSFTVTVLDDTRMERDEDVLLTLGSPTNAAVLGTPRLAVLRIQASDQQPDVMVGPRRLDGTSYVGFDVFNSTGRGQTVTVPGRRTQTRAVYFRVGTAGNAVGAFRVKGSAAPPNTRVRYFLGGKDVTAALRSPEGKTVLLRPGRRVGYEYDGISSLKVVTAKVTILRGAVIGSRKPVAVRSIYKGDARLVDKAKGIVKVVR